MFSFDSNKKLQQQAKIQDMILEHHREQDYDVIWGEGEYRKMKQAEENGAIVIHLEQGEK